MTPLHMLRSASSRIFGCTSRILQCSRKPGLQRRMQKSIARYSVKQLSTKPFSCTGPQIQIYFSNTVRQITFSVTCIVQLKARCNMAQRTGSMYT
jgi:hypothetical protein